MVGATVGEYVGLFVRESVGFLLGDVVINPDGKISRDKVGNTVGILVRLVVGVAVSEVVELAFNEVIGLEVGMTVG